MLSKKFLSSILGSVLAFSPLITSYANTHLPKTTNPETQKETGAYDYDLAKKLIQTGFYLPESQLASEPITLDLLLKQNLDVALKNALEFILNGETTAFIDNKENLNKCILQDDLLCRYIKRTISLIDNKEISESDRQFQILQKLSNMSNYMKINKDIPETNNFFKFISAMEYAYKTVISRKISNEILSESRDKIEKTMGSQTASSDANLSTGADIDGVILGISAGAQTSEASSETSFYTIDSSAKIGVSVGVGLRKYLSLSAEENMMFTRSLVLYSLEQFLDSSLKDGKLSNLQLRESDIKKISNSRKQMQETEKKLISLMQNSVEWYLKATEIVPQNVILKWPDITTSKSADKKNTVNCSLSANAAASCLASIGMDVSTSIQESTIHTYNKYLELIENDCSPSIYGENSESISKFLKQDKVKKYCEIKKSIEDYIETHQDLSEDEKNEMISIMISNLTGDIKIYNNALSVLADENATKEEKTKSKETKKSTEKQWIGSSKISRLGKGRSEILKTAIALASYFSEISTQDKNKPLLCKLYNEIEHLAKIQVFSKNKSNQKAEYSTSRKCYSTNINGKTYFKIPVLGTTALNIEYNENLGDASFDTNKNITIQVQIPMVGDKALGTYSIRENFKKILEKVSKIKNNPFAEELKKSVSLLDSNFENILKEYGISIPLSIPEHFKISKYMLLNFYFTKIDKTKENSVPLPLPGSHNPIITDSNEWVLKLIKRIDTASANVNLSAANVGDLKLSSQMGKISSKIGNNTLTFLANKFNALNTGFDEDNSDEELSENILWQNFKKAQLDELLNLLVNISKKTNVRYELQCMWNEISKNISKDKATYKNAYKNFKNFLMACKNLSKNKSQKNFDTASELFDKVLKLNYEFNYMPELIKVHSISK